MSDKTFEVRGMTHAMASVAAMSQFKDEPFFDTLLQACEGMDAPDAWQFIELFAGQ